MIFCLKGGTHLNLLLFLSHQFEVGKRTVSHIMERGKMQLVLITGEVRSYLASESEASLATSFLRLALGLVLPTLFVIVSVLSCLLSPVYKSF